MKFILNADDYALSGPVDDAIVHLACEGVVGAASALACAQRWPQAARRIAGLPIDVGLHLCLTSAARDGHDDRLLPLLGRALLRTLNSRALRAAIAQQCDRFEDALGRAPVFVDGHQHVHQLPQVREALLDELALRYAPSLPALRVCRPAVFRGLKAALIAALGAAPLEHAARAKGCEVNSDFAGVYRFATSRLPAQWRQWLGSLSGERPLVMCHVARTREGAVAQYGDPILAARLAEFAWLSSAAFKTLCEEFSARPARWSELRATRS